VCRLICDSSDLTLHTALDSCYSVVSLLEDKSDMARLADKSVTHAAVVMMTAAGFLGGCSTTSQMVVPADVSRVSDVIAATDRKQFHRMMGEVCRQLPFALAR